MEVGNENVLRKVVLIGVVCELEADDAVAGEVGSGNARLDIDTMLFATLVVFALTQAT
jgi:hypothetical protein